AGDDFLARAGRSEDQHRDVRLRRGADPLEDEQHLLVAADHFAEALDRRRLIFAADRGAALEELVEQIDDGVVLRPVHHVARRQAGGEDLRDAEVDELADAVLDVETQTAEGLHQRLDVEALLRTRAEVSQEAGAKRRLYEGAKTGFEVRRLSRSDRGCRARATRAEGKVVHWNAQFI